MVDTEKLSEIIRLSGIKKSKLADALGISLATLKRKIEGASPFTLAEVDTISQLLGITSLSEREKIFNKK